MAVDGSGSFPANEDPELRELLPLYLAHRSSDLEAATTALKRSDYGVLYEIGHNLHGSGRSFGFDELTLIGCELERAARATDHVAIALQLDHLKLFLSRADVAAARNAVLADATLLNAVDSPDANGAAEILLVDDQEMNAAIFSRYLTHEGYAVKYLASGDAALAALEQGPLPALILLDVMMIGTDGLEVCRRIKSNPATSGITVMVVTGMDSRDDRIQGWAAGADDVMSKPVRREELVRRVRSMVSIKKPAGDGLLRVVSPSSEGEGG